MRKLLFICVVAMLSSCATRRQPYYQEYAMSNYFEFQQFYQENRESFEIGNVVEIRVEDIYLPSHASLNPIMKEADIPYFHSHIFQGVLDVYGYRTAGYTFLNSSLKIHREYDVRHNPMYFASGTIHVLPILTLKEKNKTTARHYDYLNY
ncbi:MAG: hypothetical protein LBR84_06300 [Tannerella sp.]|jgi:hypothetical protein|nr:hypothetical protein [Tannerella sp.]